MYKLLLNIYLKMGLDDLVDDSKIRHVIENSIKEFVSCYSDIDELTERNLTKWESKLCYTGYSIAFHTLYPVYETVLWNGSNNREMTSSEKNQVKKVVRNRIIEIIQKKHFGIEL
jgi:predicted house-cleaning noncanonical NTP pyrophosphatase (MazG superfamily)